MSVLFAEAPIVTDIDEFKLVITTFSEGSLKFGVNYKTLSGTSRQAQLVYDITANCQISSIKYFNSLASGLGDIKRLKAFFQWLPKAKAPQQNEKGQIIGSDIGPKKMLLIDVKTKPLVNNREDINNIQIKGLDLKLGLDKVVRAIFSKEQLIIDQPYTSSNGSEMNLFLVKL